MSPIRPSVSPSNPASEPIPWSSEEVINRFEHINTKELERRAELKKPYYDFTTGYVISYGYVTEKLMSKVSYWYVYKLQRLDNGTLELVPFPFSYS